jgi:alpha-amylase/alpha-mannosidase (GH57 family)
MKKLSLAFIWHLHQPDYKTPNDNVMLMPWTRLNAVKAYSGMLDFFEEFPNLKLNFDISPTLLDAIEGYANETITDIHANLTLTPVEELTEDDMEFILNYFFDLDYNQYIAKYPRYEDLYKRRFSVENIDTDEFSMSGYSDIMTLYNLVWFQDKQIEEYPEIKEIALKGKHYTNKHREILLNAQKDIIKKIIPNFRRYAEEKKIEILSCPYYHPILPIVADMDSAKHPNLRMPLPGSDIKMPDCAKKQIENGINRVEEIFGIRPKGMWTPEQGISPEVAKMIAECGIEWTISDESVLAATINKDIIRDFKGFHQDPFNLCQTYSLNFANDLKVIFRDSVLPNLISFEYPNYDAKTAARDLYDRIKVVYSKFLNAPSENHLLTIAMDGENAWNNYNDGGKAFIRELYKLIEEDPTIETVLVSDYINTVKHFENLDTIKAGSGVNSDFKYWTAEPTKNIAWRYLFNVYEDLKRFEREENIPQEKLKIAYEHIYTAQGSDWFWWFGEPNDSGQDHLFDFLFREHLKAVYSSIDKPIPEHLDNPLSSFSGKPSRTPKALISPQLTGKRENENDWNNAGCIDISSSPLMQDNKLFNKILFGCDYDNLYFRFDINQYIYNLHDAGEQIYQVYIYIKTNKEEFQYTAPVRPVNKTENICQLIKNSYTHEIKLTFMQNKEFPLLFSKAIKNNLWVMDKINNIQSIYNEVIEIKIPFKDINVNVNEKIDFFIINGTFGRVEDVYPQDLWLTIKRPEKSIQ